MLGCVRPLYFLVKFAEVKRKGLQHCVRRDCSSHFQSDSRKPPVTLSNNEGANAKQHMSQIGILRTLKKGVELGANVRRHQIENILN